MSATRRVIVLLSGGMDSATALALAMREGFEVYALSFHYGQRHAIELEFARRLAAHFCVAEHRRVDIDPSAGLNGLRGSVLWRQHRLYAWRWASRMLRTTVAAAQVPAHFGGAAGEAARG